MANALALDDFVSQVMTELECPICFDPFSTPIYTCANGHSVCGTCSQKLTNCGVCRAPGKPSRRVLALEALVTVVKVPCKNVRYGCKQKLSIARLNEHVENCAFVGFGQCTICPNWRAPDSKGFLHHLVNFHKALVVPSKLSGNYIISTGIFKLGSTSTAMNVVVDSTFWVRLSFDGASEVLTCMAWHIGSGAKAGRFSYSIELKAKVGVASVRYTRAVATLKAQCQQAIFVTTKAIVNRNDEEARFILTFKENGEAKNGLDPV